MHVVMLANPENRRSAYFREALNTRGVGFVEVSWEKFLTTPEDLLDRLRHDSVLRIESPGENSNVERLFRQEGEALAHGQLWDMRRAHQGFVEALRALAGHTCFMNAPSAITAMFDKVQTHQILNEADVPTAEFLGTFSCYDALMSLLDARQRRRVFVKFRFGSSASAVVALYRGKRHSEAITSVEMAEGRFFNSLKIRRYRREDDLRNLFDFIGSQGGLVETWIPKATSGPESFDLRILCIGGEPTHTVVRMAHKSPLTNLHLGNRRGDISTIRTLVGDDTWQRAHTLATRAQSAFDGALYAGVDVAIDVNFRRVVVLEVNAFGDLLPNVLDATGRNTYLAEVDALLEREAA